MLQFVLAFAIQDQLNKRILPEGWSITEGSAESPLWGRPAVLDNTGRFLYCYDGYQWDFKSGKRRHIHVWARHEVGYRPERWSAEVGLAWGKDPNADRLTDQEWDFTYASGLTVAGRVGITAGWGYDHDGFIAGIGGPGTKISSDSGQWPLVRAWLDLLVPCGYTLGADSKRNKPGPGTPAANEILVVHKGKIHRFKVPAPYSNCGKLNGGVRWRRKTVFALELDEANPGRLIEIALRGRSASVRRAPKMPGGGVIMGVLANGTVCAESDTGTGSSVRSTVKVFDVSRWKWRLFPGLTVFATSANGKFVAFTWGEEQKLRVAMVKGDW